MTILIAPNEDPNIKEPCFICQGRGYHDQIILQFVDDKGTQEIIREETTICQRCHGNKEVMAAFTETIVQPK